jgi:hypothetical protein
MPSGFEAEIDESSNKILWKEGQSQEFKKKYLPPQAIEILRLKAIHEKYVKMNKKSKASEMKVTLKNRAITEFDLKVGHLDIFSLGVALYHLLTLRYPFV